MIDLKAAKQVKDACASLRREMGATLANDLGDGLRNKITDLMVNLETLLESIEDEYPLEGVEGPTGAAQSTCPVHGDFKPHPNKNGDAFCPECWNEAVRKGLGVEHIDKPSDYATSSISIGASTPKSTVSKFEMMWGKGKPLQEACPRCGEKALVSRPAIGFGALGGAVECEACTSKSTLAEEKKVTLSVRQAYEEGHQDGAEGNWDPPD